MGECKICSGDDNISYTCNECGGTYCSTHRLPEAHNCYALRRKTYDESWFKDELSVRDNHHRSENARVNDENEEEESERSGPDPMSVEQIRENKTSTNSSSRDPAAEADSEGSCLECGAATGLECRQCGGRYCENHVELDAHNCQLKSQEKESVGSSTDTPPKPRMPGTDTPSRGRRAASSALSLIMLPFTLVYATGSWFTSHWKLSVVSLLVVAGGALGATGQLGPMVDGGFESAASVFDDATDDTGGAVGGADSEGERLNESKIEQRIHEAINEERQERRLTPLARDGELAEIADGHSEHMAEDDFYDHETPEGETMVDRYRKAGYECRVPTGDGRYAQGAENIAMTYAFTLIETQYGGVDRLTNETEVANSLVNGWMNSRGHRENILTPYWEHEGIGIEVVDREDGGGVTIYATQNFC